MTPALQFGPRLEPGGGVTFRLWAPAAKRVELVGADEAPMRAGRDGWFSVFVPQAGPGFRYRFRIDGELAVPDPASHFQPEDVGGPSEVVDHDYAWRRPQWKGRPWHEAVILELHVGTFTPEGTFRAAIERLDHLAHLGVTAIELMPLAEFAGSRNWGYDGVLPYAPDSAYGRPEDLQALIDEAHARGLMAFLDVVYNHFGPEGNYLPRYAPAFFTAEHHTPWGDAIDYRVPQVRAFAIENALHWLTQYRFDGLRLDAVHAISEPGAPPILEELSRRVGELAAQSGRHIHLVLENDDNIARLLDPLEARPGGKYRAQWNDDYHHAWHVLLTGEQRGYYRDYAEAPARAVGRALACGFVYQGEASAHRQGAPRGQPSGHLPPTAFVNFLQNHDQIGNRAYGERLTTLAEKPALDAALAVTLLAPAVPLLFMGEEWGATQPFPFFCDFHGELAEAVRRGRKAEFAAQFAELAEERPIPDPLDDATFKSAVLSWGDRGRAPHGDRLKLVRALLAARRDHIVPLAARLGGGCGAADLQGSVLSVAWSLGGGERLRLLANLSAGAAPLQQHIAPGQAIWGGDPSSPLPPWAVHWRLERA